MAKRKKTTKRTATAKSPKAKPRAPKPAQRPAAAQTGVGAAITEFCRALPHTVEDVKWGADLIFSVGVPGKVKMFAGFELDNPDEFAFKCSEDDFLRLIQIDGIVPAPYMAKHFWVKVHKPGARSTKQWQDYLRKAHGLVAESLPVGVRKQMKI